ncbi:hypothetical protein [Deminuibacter soli]|nr:hypothetical protein [Deminuibacter soli]
MAKRKEREFEWVQRIISNARMLIEPGKKALFDEWEKEAGKAY